MKPRHVCVKTCAVNTLRWDFSPDEIRTTTDGLINRVNKVYDDIESLHIENVSVENTLKALAHAKPDYACKRRGLHLSEDI
uniref:Uncharacterized protein n=1 Tax=Mastacembelus armatus TaxID=205130 RepID=A0A3Q3L2B3_9TELE